MGLITRTKQEILLVSVVNSGLLEDRIQTKIRDAAVDCISKYAREFGGFPAEDTMLVGPTEYSFTVLHSYPQQEQGNTIRKMLVYYHINLRPEELDLSHMPQIGTDFVQL